MYRELNPYHKLKMIGQVLLMAMKEWSTYRINMLLSLINGPLNIIVQIFIWRAIYTPGMLLNGLSLTNMLTYYGVMTIISIFVSDQAASDLRWQVYSGSLVTLLQRPISHLYYMFYQKIGQKLISLFCEVIPLVIIVVFVFRIHMVPSNAFWFVLSIFLSFVMVFLVNYCIGITSFWLTNNTGISMSIVLLSQLCTGLYIPLVFFPTILQKLLFFLPFQYMSYVSVRVFLGSYVLGGMTFTIPQIVLIQLAYVLLMLLFTSFLWSRAMRTFTGVGT